MRLELTGYENQTDNPYIKTPDKSGTFLVLEKADMDLYIKITIGDETVVVKAADLSKATLLF
jgi:hypothetical protein